MNKVTFKASLVNNTTIFEVQGTEGDTPSSQIKTAPTKVQKGIIRRVHFRLNPTNAVTYHFLIYSGSEANDYACEAKKVFDTRDLIVAAGDCADDTEYDAQLLDIPFYLDDEGFFYIVIVWSGAPSTTTGYIEIEGEKLD